MACTITPLNGRGKRKNKPTSQHLNIPIHSADAYVYNITIINYRYSGLIRYDETHACRYTSIL